MDGENEIGLGAVQETLLLPLWGRAAETLKDNPLLMDQVAVSIVRDIGYDFSKVKRNINELSRLSWVARSIYFDTEIERFLDKYPDGSVVNIGCGLDTTFDRIDNGTVSVLGTGWYSKIESKYHVFLLIAGVIYYFDEKNVRMLFSRLAQEFGKVDLVLDYSSKRGVKIANKKVIESGGIDKKASLVWGIDDIYELEKWETGLRVLHDMPMFHHHKKNYPVLKRLGMTISDKLKIMSLTHIEING
jgi:O-methyltransferase involved in polyketide biosynthesis